MLWARGMATNCQVRTIRQDNRAEKIDMCLDQSYNVMKLSLNLIIDKTTRREDEWDDRRWDWPIFIDRGGELIGAGRDDHHSAHTFADHDHLRNVTQCQFAQVHICNWDLSPPGRATLWATWLLFFSFVSSVHPPATIPKDGQAVRVLLLWQICSNSIITFFGALTI